MKSKNPKIQILKKGIATFMSAMLIASPLAYATTSLDDSYLQSSLWDKILYGTIGSTAKEIEEYLVSHSALYITNETQLRAFAEYVNNGNDCAIYNEDNQIVGRKEIILLNDIELNKNEEWVPINIFNGIFNGNNCTISGSRYSSQNKYLEEELNNIGFFKKIDTNGLVKNLILDDVEIDLASAIDNGKNVGGIVGNNSGAIENCTVKEGQIIGNDYVGGIAGIVSNVNASVSSCTNNASVIGSTAVGGIVGQNLGKIQKNENNGEITGGKEAEYVGGIVGYNIKNIKDCRNNGSILGEETRYVGGIAGINYYNAFTGMERNIENCINNGSVLGSEFVAGIVGAEIDVNIGNTIGNIKDSENTAKISGTEYVGGIIGFLSSNEIIITNCINRAKVEGSAYVGGIIGSTHTTINKLVNCKNLGEIENGEDIIGEQMSFASVSIETGNSSNIGFNSEGVVIGAVHTTSLEQSNDTEAPTVEITAGVKNALETKRYTAGKDIIIEVVTNEQIVGDINRPELEISFSKSGLGKYNYNGEIAGLAKCIDAKIDLDGITTWTYVYQIQEFDEGELQIKCVSGEIVDLAGNRSDLASDNFLDIDSNIYADTTAPTVTITAWAEKESGDKSFINITNNTTNANKILYTFTVSEEVEGFTLEDITINNGTTMYKEFGNSIDENGEKIPNVYLLEVIPSTTNGNVGEVQIIVEQNACQDKVGLGNVRTESIIMVDKIAPILISVEAYGKTAPTLNKDIAPVKEYYKPGDIVEIVATFSENIENSAAPELVLQFSESGNSKETVSPGEKSGNKITYSYTIQSGDKGILSVKGFTGEVVDTAGNKTIVTKRNLEGDTIIVDNVAPTLNNITAIAPSFEYDELLLNGETKRYGVESKTRNNNTITIIAEYSENVYNLANNEINKITDSTDPVLTLKFGNTNAKGTVIFEKVEENKIYYKYDIQSGDNGVLSIVSLNGTVCDIAGNTVTTGNQNIATDIVADTTKVAVSLSASAVNYDDDKNLITGNGNYYREGAVITITATTNEYVYKNNNKTLTRFEELNAPVLNINFSESGAKKGNVLCTNVDYKENKTIFTYTYEIQKDDNGTLKISFAEKQGYDIALNENTSVEKTISDIIADTVDPVTNWQSWVTDEGYGIEDFENGTWKVTFNTTLYTYNPTSYTVGSALSNSNKSSAPKLLVTKDNITELETTVSNIKTENGKTVITYTYSPYTRNIGVKGMTLANVSDKAGNLLNAKDQIAPQFSNIRVTSPVTGTYSEGEVVTIVATFNEKIKGTAPVLTLKFGDKDAKGTVSAGVINDKTITYTYTITANDNKGNGDNRELSIKSYVGSGIKDLSDNECTLPTTVNLASDSNRIIADTIAPTITKVEAKVSDEVIAEYIVGTSEYITGKRRTNADTVNYVITFSENINLLDADAIKLINAEKGNVTVSGNTLTIEAHTITESVQSLIVPANIVEDGVGHLCENYIRFNAVTVDFTKPTVRFISEYNGGAYVLPTNIDKVEIRPNVEISEDISKIEYKWDNEEYVQIENYSSSSDISVPSRTFTEDGQHKLFIKVTDLAGNITETNKTYEVVYSNIEIDVDKIDYTNQDVTATVSFGEGLTDNRKVIFKAEGSEELVELRAEGTNENGTEYTIYTNGTIYVEATDKVGNKVFTERTIYNIDKVKPEVELSLNGANLVIGTGKESATVKTIITTSEPAIISHSWYGIVENGENITGWSETREYVTSKEIEYSTKSGEHYLNIKVTDKAGNETIVKSNPFTVVNTNEKEKITIVEGENGPEERKEIIPAEKPVSELIIFEQREENEKDKAYVYVNHDYSIIEDLEITLADESYGYVSEYKSIELYGNTTIIVKAWDACGNEVKNEYKVEDIEGPEFTIIGNPENWTNGDILLEIQSNAPLEALIKNGENILGDNKYRVNTVIDTYGIYTFEATDIYNNTSKQDIEVKIDKFAPEITDVKIENGVIVITANDIDKTLNKELSGVAEYAITDTTEVPLEWSTSNEIRVTKDGTFYAWAKDNAGNVSRAENTIVVDTTAPTITFNYLSQTVTVGMPLEAYILTNEEATISYSWDKENWTASEGYLTAQKVSEKSTTPRVYTLYAKVTDKAGNESAIQTLEFTVTNMEEIKQPEIVFEDIPTIQINGTRYVKVSSDMTKEGLTDKMNGEALCGKTPEYTKLTEDGKLKTGSEIAINGSTKYVIVVNGDVNCDGKVTPIDVTYANSIRLNKVNAVTIQKLAADFNLDGNIKPIDITMINSYRLGKIKGI